MSVRDLIMAAAGVSTYSGFDVRKATYVSALNLSSSGCAETWPRGVLLNSAGTKMFLAGYNQKPLYSVALSTPFDPLTASGWANSTNLNTTCPHEITPDMTKIISVDGTKVRYGTMSTPGSISSLTYVAANYVELNAYFSTIETIRFSATGDKLFVAGIASGIPRIYEFPLSTPNNVTTWGSPAYKAISDVQVSTVGDFFFSSDGKCLLVLRADRIIVQYNLATPWSIVTAEQAWTFSVAGIGLGYVTGFCLTNNDAKMLLTGMNVGSNYVVAIFSIGS